MTLFPLTSMEESLDQWLVGGMIIYDEVILNAIFTLECTAMELMYSIVRVSLDSFHALTK